MTEHYQAYFCEENIWHLAAKMPGVVVFISNAHNQFAIWEQKLARQDELDTPRPIDSYILWDYHVVFAHGPRETADFENLADYISQDECVIYDYDTQLPKPCKASRYFFNSFPVDKYLITREFQPRFRLIDAKEYVNRFWSDRSHMKNEDEEWSAVPPSWPCIMSEHKNKLRLTRLLNFTRTGNESIYELNDFQFSEHAD